MRNRVLHITFLFFIVSVCYCQINDSLRSILFFDDFLENTTDNFYLDEELKELLNNPIKINFADKEDLLKIPFFNDIVVDEIILTREKRGGLTRNDLKNILNNNHIYRLVNPFISYDKNNPVYHVNLKTGISSEIQNRRGYDSVFVGDKLKIMTKLNTKITPYNISFGFSTDKDPGEKSLIDHYNVYLKYENNNIKAILGDYKVAFASGLNFSNQTFMFSSDDYYSFCNYKSNVSAYNGTDEYNYLRGLALEFNNNSLKYSFFYSNKNIDANINNNIITSLYKSGLHRYSTETNKKDILNENIFGGKLSYNLNNHILSIMSFRIKYDKSFSTSEYYGLKGDLFNVSGFSYYFKDRNLTILSEFSLDKSNHLSAFMSSSYRISDNYFIYGLLRFYPESYVNPFSFPFSSNGKSQNEKGILLGMKIIPHEKVTLDWFYDIYKIPYRTYFNPLPSRASAYMVKINFILCDYISIMLRYKGSNSEEYIKLVNTQGKEEKAITDKVKDNIRLELLYSPFHNMILKTRIENNNFKYKVNSYSENGFMVFQDLNYKLMSGFGINFRFIYFNTNSFETAIYEYENDITGIYSVSSLYNKGYRFYFFIDYSFYKLQFLIKFSNTTYNNLNKIGSSYEEIKGNSLSKITFELNYKL